jgi:glutamate---cysteine ligase / carboxylate-amine ligase
MRLSFSASASGAPKVAAFSTGVLAGSPNQTDTQERTEITMITKAPSFSFGIEEEFFLVDLATRDLAASIPPALFAACAKRLGKRFCQEYMHAQVEVCTPVCTSMETARRSLTEARLVIAQEAGKFGLAPIAASTHPFTRWEKQAHAGTTRYRAIAQEFQGVGRRMIINGLHVHVGIASNAERIRLMNAIKPILPLLLALSTSSPFWQGEVTGLKSYRTAVNDSTPRKGIPEDFSDWRDYQRTIGALQKAGVIEDASKVWWDLRPSANFPTLEMRITDACPKLEDGLCLAALFCCYCRYLSRTPDAGAPGERLALINENRWRAQRYGLDDGLIDPATGKMSPVDDLVDDLLRRIGPDANALDCAAEVEHARTILARGTSADRQLAFYRRLRKDGRSAKAALRGVVDLLAVETATLQTALRAKAGLQVSQEASA